MANTLPRPKPPGRVGPRRPSLTTYEPNDPNIPPPPYVVGKNSLLSATRDDFDLSSIALEDKSKEELSSLLLQASSTLSARQNDLTMAASIGQELVQINKELQSKYDALQAQRSPRSVPMEPSSPGVSHVGQLGLTSDRKIQEAISLLQSQNEMLMTQIRHLEEESFESQKQGKKRIMLLEKEMSLLRSGLDLSQQRAQELESQLEEDRGREVRRMVHHKRLNALRQRLARPDNHFRNSRDFVPGTEPGVDHYSDTCSPPLSPDVSSDSLPELSPIPSSSRKSRSPFIPPQEYMAGSSADDGLSNELLRKITELEIANKELIASQLDIKARLENLNLSKDSNSTEFLPEISPTESVPPSQTDRFGALPQLRRRRVESQGSGQLRFKGLSAPPTPFYMDFPPSHSEMEINHSLLDELTQVQENTTPDISDSPEQSFLEHSDDRFPTLPGAFESPVKSPILLEDRYQRRRAQSLVDTRARSPSYDADDAEDNMLQLSPTSAPNVTNNAPTTSQRSSFFVELWLFLQFCVIIVVFMFSMGRRIPPQHLR